jgi:hypothetical protein
MNVGRPVASSIRNRDLTGPGPASSFPRMNGPRRRAILALLGCALAARSAHALRIEEATEPALEAYRERCETQALHADIVRQLYREIRIREGEERAREILQALPCPVCGCSLAQAVVETPLP